MTDPVVQLLIDLYDPFDPDRSDLEAYLAMAEEFEARSVLDFGCGTGVLALLLAERGLEVTGIDPSLESLVVAKRDAPARVISIYGAERPVPLLADKVTWLHGFARDLPEMQVDLVVCTGNAMQQAFVDDADWTEILEAMHRVLKPGGRVLILEFSLPANRPFRALYLFYFRHILPRIGALLSGDSYAYRYLNETVETFPYGEDFCRLMRDAGFEGVSGTPLTFGIATLYQGDVGGS